MAPKRMIRKKKEEVCEFVEGDRFYAPPHDAFRFNWWEICCFPYILGARVWDCCVSMIAGTNQCMIYWMLLQWLVCKINKMTTPDPILFPYFFYMFCQVILLTIVVCIFLYYVGPIVIFPYFEGFYHHIVDEEEFHNRPPPTDAVTGQQIPTTEGYNETDNETTHASRNFRVAFRRYCFRRGDIFDVPLDVNYCSRPHCSYPVRILSIFTMVVMHEYL